MYKIFVYIGSRAGEKSFTASFLRDVLDLVVDHVGKDNIVIDFNMPDSTNINPCLSCNQCFYKGVCIQDETDDMNRIKSSILDSDLIVFATPVYFHNVSGDMKIFIDRISYWSHLMRLAGKSGISVVTSSGNGLEMTNEYLTKFMLYLGIKVVKMAGVSYNSSSEDYRKCVFDCKTIICDYLNGKRVETDDRLEAIFQAFRSLVGSYHPDSAEYIYWRENGLLDCNSFEDVLGRT